MLSFGPYMCHVRPIGRAASEPLLRAKMSGAICRHYNPCKFMRDRNFLGPFVVWVWSNIESGMHKPSHRLCVNETKTHPGASHREGTSPACGRRPGPAPSSASELCAASCGPYPPRHILCAERKLDPHHACTHGHVDNHHSTLTMYR